MFVVKMFLSSREGILHEGLMTCFRGEVRGTAEGQKDYSASAVSQTLSLTYSTCQSTISCGNVS